MNSNKKSFIFAMALLLGIFFLPDVTKADFLVPEFTAGIGDENSGDYNTSYTPFTLQSADGLTGVSIGYTPKVIDTWVDTGNPSSPYAEGFVSWYIDEPGDPLEVHLTFKYVADANNEVWWYTPLGDDMGVSDGIEHFVDLTFTIMGMVGEYVVTFEVYNHGGQAQITDLQGLPLPAHTPIPGSVLLLATGLAGLGVLGRRRRKV